MQVAWRGSHLGARLIRSTGWVAIGYAASQAIRLFSNLILTRILFPEAFGLMALITVFLVGLNMLSDIGVSPSIQQSNRGDDPEFINTAWTLQVIRGVALWIASCVISVWAAWFYSEPQLQTMLPVAGLALLIAGFDPTRILTASRHLTLGRVTVLTLVCQVLSLIVMLILAYVTRSVWALVLGGVFAAITRLVIMTFWLPGPHNRFLWSPEAAREIITFGKWIFLSTLCGFLLAQGDKAILGKYLTLEALGIYNVGYFLASFPQLMAATIMSQVMIPLHRERPPGQSAENFASIRKIRFALTFLVLGMQFVLAFSGIWLVELLYDDNFVAAGGIVVIIACMNFPYLIGMTYEYAALSRGDSRAFFALLLFKAVTQTGLFILGMELHGLIGALCGLWLAQVLAHPVVIWLAHRHKAWDPLHDVIYAVFGFAAAAFILTYHWVDLESLLSTAFLQ